MTMLYSLFVRYWMNDSWIDNVFNSDYVDLDPEYPKISGYYTNDKDCFIGAFGSQEAAQEALAQTDLGIFKYRHITSDDYAEDSDDESYHERPTPAGFVIAHCLGETLAVDVVKKAGDKASSDKNEEEIREWQESEYYADSVREREAEEALDNYTKLSESNDNRLAKKRSIEECLIDDSVEL